MASETPDIPETQAEKAAAWDAMLSAGARVNGEPHYGAEAAEQIVAYMRVFRVDWRSWLPKPPAVTFKHYALDGWGWEDGAGNCQTGLPTREDAISARKHFEATGHFDYQSGATLPEGYELLDDVLTASWYLYAPDGIRLHKWTHRYRRDNAPVRVAHEAIAIAKLHKVSLVTATQQEDIETGTPSRWQGAYIQPNTHLCADACPECGGTGEWAGLSGMPMHPCRDCGGTGRR